MEQKKKDINHKKKHQGEQSNHNHCRNIEDLSHLITQAQQELLSSSLNAFFFLTLPSCFQVCVCRLSIVSLCNHFYLYICHSSCVHHLLPFPPSTHPSTACSFKNHKAGIFFLIYPQASHPLVPRKRVPFLLHVFFSIHLCVSLHPLRPGEAVITAAGDNGQNGCGFPDGLSRRTMMRLYLCLVCPPRVSSASWLFTSKRSRAITGLFEMLKSVCASLFQPASGRVCLP